MSTVNQKQKELEKRAMAYIRKGYCTLLLRGGRERVWVVEKLGAAGLCHLDCSFGNPWISWAEAGGIPSTYRDRVGGKKRKETG